MQKTKDIKILNDRCPSLKSNDVLDVASMQTPVDGNGGCFSSGAVEAAVIKDNVSEKKGKRYKETTRKRSRKSTSGKGKCRGSSSKTKTKAIKPMLSDTEPYTTHVRIGKAFQAEVPTWSGPINSDVIGEQVLDPSECMHEKIVRQSSKVSPIGNWLQCKQEVNGKICGKWRRAPLFEKQTDNWECFCSVLWDPPHSDCSVPQELETDEILRQLKYIQMLRNRLAPKPRKLNISGYGGPSSTRKS